MLSLGMSSKGLLCFSLLFRSMSNTLALFVDPFLIDPPEDYWPEGEVVGCIIDGCWGIYVPQQFCKRYEKVEGVSQQDWDICLAGPEHELYWDAWDEVLSNWQFEETDSNGGVWRISLQQDGDLFQFRELVRCEGRDSDD